MNDNSIRYKRQILMDEFGIEGQDRLQNSSVLVVGAGGLGSPLLYYLAAAGVGRLVIVDFDMVEKSNLNRQILHGTQDIGKLKVDSAAASIRSLNPNIQIATHCEKITAENVSTFISDVDLVVDAVDSFGAKFVLNDGCVAREKPFIHAGATGMKGQLYLYRPGNACLRCIFPDVPSYLEGPQGLGILGATAGVIGTMQALMSIQFLAGKSSIGENELLAFDGEGLRQSHVKIPKSASCPICS